MHARGIDQRVRTLLIALTAVAGVGCGELGADEDMTAGGDGPAGPCVPGQSIPCECDDGSPGAQVCEGDGNGYDVCSCAGADGSAADDGPGGGDDGPAGDDGEPSDGGGPSDDGDPGDDGSPSDGGVVGTPTWSGDVVPFLVQYCGANNMACHSREAYVAIADKGCLGWASFEDAPLGSQDTEGAATGCPDLGLYERIVERSPWQCGAFFGAPTETLIVPGDADASYMIKKMTGQLMCDDSEPMPPPDSEIVVPPEAMQMFRAWIDAGAPMD